MVSPGYLLRRLDWQIPVLCDVDLKLINPSLLFDGPHKNVV